MIVLIGFMGAGKTTVGSLVADRLGRPFIDTDREVERAAGMSIARLFEERGEGAFRELERDVVTATLQREDAVISLGGGALGDPATRAALEWADVVHLVVSFGEALRRIGGSDRPLLRSGDVKALYDDRGALYSSAARTTVETDGRDPDEIAAEIAKHFGSASESRVRVATDPGYDVIIGEGLVDRIADLVPIPPGTERFAILTHPEVRVYAERVAGALSPRNVGIIEVPAGEQTKSLESAGRVLESLTGLGLRRSDLILGVGGGVISDLAGFVASTYHRGISVAHVATTLLAQVDAAIGGKTAVDLPAGKNLVGTFHQPIGVVCDTTTLDTLSAEEFRSGLVEVIKAGFISEPGLLEILESNSDALLARERALVRTIIVRAVAIKAAVVADDERETGRRAVLNYGHTVGHALEHTRNLRHGEAVSLGMVAAAYIAQDLGFIEEEVVERHRRVLTQLGLPVSISTTLDELDSAIRQDKKGDTGPRFVLLKEVGVPVTSVEVPRDALERALKRMDA